MAFNHIQTHYRTWMKPFQKPNNYFYLVKNPFQVLSFIDARTKGMDHISETAGCTPKSILFFFGYAFTLPSVTLPCLRNGHVTKFHGMQVGMMSGPQKTFMP